MSKDSYCGIATAAGLATRLRPLTDHQPKAALPVCGVPSLYHSLWHFEKSRIDDVYINTHYLPDQITKLIAAFTSPLHIETTFEEAILGTGGLHNPMQTMRANRGALVYNSDIVSTIDLDAMIDLHESTDAVATLAVLPEVPVDKTSSLRMHEGKIVSIAEQEHDNEQAKPCYGAGIFLFSHEFFEKLPETGSFSIIPTIQEWMAAGRVVSAYEHTGFWRDLGDSPQDFWKTHIEILADYERLLDTLGLAELWERQGHSFDFFDTNFWPESANLSEANIGDHVIVQGDVTIGADSHLDRCILLPHANIAAGESVKSCIAGPDNLRVPIQVV